MMEDMPNDPDMVETPSTAAAPRTGAELSFRVSAKGAVSVYGLGRFPVTLYREQWDRLLAKEEALREFLATHNDELKKRT